jgi:hypothetical protein
MNFQAVDQAKGKNVDMWATLDTWDGIAFTTNQAKYLSCKLTDDNGVDHKCRIYEGKGSLPGQEHLEKRMEFSIGSYQGNYKGQPYTGYSGFWSHGAVKGSQSPQKSAQATNTSQTGNDIEIRTSLVSAYIASGSEPLAESIEYWMKYCKTGIDASLPGNKPIENQPEDRRATDEDVPY